MSNNNSLQSTTETRPTHISFCEKKSKDDKDGSFCEKKSKDDSNNNGSDSDDNKIEECFAKLLIYSFVVKSEISDKIRKLGTKTAIFNETLKEFKKKEKEFEKEKEQWKKEKKDLKKRLHQEFDSALKEETVSLRHELEKYKNQQKVIDSSSSSNTKPKIFECKVSFNLISDKMRFHGFKVLLNISTLGIFILYQPSSIFYNDHTGMLCIDSFDKQKTIPIPKYFESKKFMFIVITAFKHFVRTKGKTPICFDYETALKTIAKKNSC